MGLSWDGKMEPLRDCKVNITVQLLHVKGRDVILDACSGIELTGTNAEVALGQWEYQCFGKGIKAADDLWASRYHFTKLLKSSVYQ